MHSQRDNDPRLIAFARQMRREPSDAEQRMWWLLRRNRMGGFRFRRQMPLLGYIADFCCTAAKCVIEVDGAQHGEPSQMVWDATRTAVFEEAGYRVLRFTAWDVLKFPDAVAATIYKQLCGTASPATGNDSRSERVGCGTGRRELLKAPRPPRGEDPLPSPPPEYQGRE